MGIAASTMPKSNVTATPSVIETPLPTFSRLNGVRYIGKVDGKHEWELGEGSVRVAIRRWSNGTDYSVYRRVLDADNVVIADHVYASSVPSHQVAERHAETLFGILDESEERVTRSNTPAVVKAKPVGEGKGKTSSGSRTDLTHLLSAGLMEVGQKIYKKFKGVDLVGVVQKDGTVKVGDEIGKSLSDAAVIAARKVVQNPSLNGWVFWNTTHEGKVVQVGVLRNLYESSK